MEKDFPYQCEHDYTALLMCIAEDCQHSSRLACRLCLVSMHSHTRILLRRLTEAEEKLCQYAPAMERKTAICNLLRRTAEEAKAKLTREIDNFVGYHLNKIDSILPWAISEIYSNFTIKGRQLDSPFTLKQEDYPIERINDNFNQYLELIQKLDQIQWHLPRELAEIAQERNNPEEQPTKSEVVIIEEDGASGNSGQTDHVSIIALPNGSETDTIPILPPVYHHTQSIQAPQEALVEIPEEKCRSKSTHKSLGELPDPTPHLHENLSFLDIYHPN